MAKKSLYIFLTSLLGALLFLILHRIVFFFLLYLLAGGFITIGLTYIQFLAWEYFSLMIVLMLGLWYGIWLGLYWYKKVYEEQSHYGFIRHLSDDYGHNKIPQTPSAKISALKQRLEHDFRQLEDATLLTPAPLEPQALTRKIVRKRAPKKVTKL